MKTATIKILKVEVGEPPQIKEIENSLQALQKEVEGLIACVYIEDGAVAVVNDEGKINGMKPNRRMGADIICGPFFICGDEGEDFSSLTEEQISKFSNEFGEIEQFTGKEPELEPHITVISFDFKGGM
ncbi:MAG: DUF3846 domain-containing protein [Anaerotignaceae bacterium]